MAQYAQMLREHPGYTKLWLAQVVSLAGDWFNAIVLTALVARFSGGSGLAVGAYLLARFVPPFLMTPFAGVLIDTFDRKRLLILSDLLRAGVVLLLLFADRPERLWLIYMLTVLQFALSAVFEPGRSALLPSLVDRDDLVPANTLASVTWSVMLAVGAVLGGVSASFFGATITLLLDALTFLVSALLIASIVVPEKPATIPELEHEKLSQDKGFREGLRYARKHPETSSALLVKLGNSIGSVDAVLIAYATTLFVWGEEGTLSLSLLWSAFGVGAILGPALSNLFNDGSLRSMRRWIGGGFAFIVVGWWMLGASPTLLIASLAVVVRAMGGSINWTYSSVIIQEATDDAYLGRMFALDMAGFQLATALSIIVTSLFLERLGNVQAPLIANYTGAASLVPLLVWTGVVRWVEKRQPAPSVPAPTGD